MKGRRFTVTKLSDAELKQRRMAVESTIGTHAMEGLAPDETTRVLMERYAVGAITLDQFSAAMQAHGRDLIARMRLLAGAA
jgi:hypothetical protein